MKFPVTYKKTLGSVTVVMVGKAGYSPLVMNEITDEETHGGVLSIT